MDAQDILCEKLIKLGGDLKIIKMKYINKEILLNDTKRLIDEYEDALLFTQDEEYYKTVNDLTYEIMKIWFPAIASHIQQCTWLRCWDLDITIMKYIEEYIKSIKTQISY